MQLSTPVLAAPGASIGGEETRFHRLRRAVVALSGFVALLVVCIAAYMTLDERAERIREAELRSRSLTRALEQHAARLFEGTGQFLVDIRKQVESDGGLGVADYDRLRELLLSERAHDLATRTAYLVDRLGEPVVTSARGTPITIYDRPDFRRHRMLADRGVTVSAPMRNVENQWVLPISIRMDDARGFFAGEAVVELDVEYLLDFYRSLDLDHDTVVSLVQPDGTYFARYPGFELVAGQPHPSPALESMQGVEGSVMARSNVDGIVRLAAYRKITGYPMLVVLALSRDRYLAPWVAHTVLRVILMAAALALLALITWLTLRRLDELRMLHETLEDHVRLRTEELAEANAELESFSYSVSHDLRAPLRHLAQYAHLLKQGGIAAEGLAPGELTARILERSRYMGELVDALLALSRIGRTPIERERLDLSAMAGQLLARLRESDPERKVEVCVEPGLWTMGDRTLVQILLQNLLGNAWKYSARNPDARIEFRRETVDGASAFVVEDNGVGFDPRYTSKLFGAFQRLHSPSDFEGTGIGLATARRIVQRHGGRIWADGEAGRGARFYFTLPPR